MPVCNAVTHLCTVGRLLAQHIDVSDPLDAAASEGETIVFIASSDKAFVLFPAGAPSVRCVHINKPLTRNDVTGRSGVKCRTLKAGSADVQLTER